MNEITDLTIPKLEKKNSSSAVVVVTIGSVAIVGAGGFSAYWFIFRKKKLIK